MAKYVSDMKDTASTTLYTGRIDAPTASPVRGKLYDLIFGSEATPADAIFLWEVNRCTGVPTGTSVTPSPLDTADAAATSEVLENVTVIGTGGVTMMAIPLNQRATFRWVAAPGSELVFPATDNNGFGFLPVVSPASIVTVTMFHEE
jgi:hypothetical protein